MQATEAVALFPAVCARIANTLRFFRTNSQISRADRSRVRPRWTALSVGALVALGALHGAWLRAGLDEWTNSGPGKAEITRVIADPFRPGRLVVGARGAADPWKIGSAWMTTDRGVTWSELGLPLYEDMAGAFRIEGVAFVPDEPDLMLAQIEPWYFAPMNEWSQALLCVSRDGGATWSNLDIGWGAVAVASRVTPGLIYRTAWSLFESSTDYGQSWQTRGTFGQNFCASSLAVAGGQPEIIWAAGRDFYTPGGLRFFEQRSRDSNRKRKVSGAPPALRLVRRARCPGTLTLGANEHRAQFINEGLLLGLRWEQGTVSYLFHTPISPIGLSARGAGDA